MLFTNPYDVTVRVGQEIDLHITTDAPTGASPGPPIYRLPGSPDDTVLRLIAQEDDGATGLYRAVASGDVVLTTAGYCLDNRTDEQSYGACPLLHVTVTP